MRWSAITAVALALTCAACGRDPAYVDGLGGAALSAWAIEGLAQPPEVRAAGAAAEGGDPTEALGLYWSWDPPVLQVYRPTAVHLKVEAFPSGHDGARCTWSFGDAVGEGAEPVEGCAVSHTFGGGLADQPVKLRLADGEWELESTRVIPLERLSVTSVADGGEAATAPGTLPEAPKPAPTSFRVVFLADTAGVEGAGAAATTVIDGLRPNLVVHVGGVVPPGGGDAAWDVAREGIERPAVGANVPLAWAMSPTDVGEGARVKRPTLTLLDGEGFPERYTFTFKGAFFMVISSDPRAGLDDDDVAWMRRALDGAQIYESRFVVSYLPLHKFGDDGAGVLNDKFRVYELLLRARVTALVSAGYHTFFKGRYGALAVLNVGTPAARGGRLSGSDVTQAGTVAVMDVVGGVPERVFAVEAPRFDRGFDEAYLPETVEVYTR